MSVLITLASLASASEVLWHLDHGIRGRIDVSQTLMEQRPVTSYADAGEDDTGEDDTGEDDTGEDDTGEDDCEVVVWYFDGDEDGYGSDVDILYSCEQPSGYTAESGDCDDEKFNISPVSLEYCNAFDDNCNGLIDEDAVDKGEWYPDLDGDGYGDPNGMVLACDQPASFVGNDTDCDDTDITEWTLVEGMSYTCGSIEAVAVEPDDSKGCSAVSGVTGGLLLSLVGLIGRRREEA